MEMDPREESRNTAKENNPHIAMEKEKVVYPLNGDHQAFPETVEPEYPAKNPEFLHILFKNHYEHQNNKQNGKNIEIVIVEKIKNPLVKRALILDIGRGMIFLAVFFNLSGFEPQIYPTDLISGDQAVFRQIHHFSFSKVQDVRYFSDCQKLFFGHIFISLSCRKRPRNL
jgi:hypothetical protein